jgi:dihydrofolate reductase
MTRPLVAVYLGVSLDGQIARSDGRLEWLDRFATSGEDYGYDAFISSIDAIILGRNTYETALGFGIWPYRNLRVIVLTHRPLDARHGEIAYEGELAPLLKKLHEDGVRKAYLDGGAAIRQGLRENVVDELTLSWIPTVLGSGRPLFAEGFPESAWRLAASKAFPSGLVQATYQRR